jgi:hypothetical protein
VQYFTEAGDAGETSAKEAYAADRLRDMLDFFETMANWYAQILRLPTGAVIKFVKMGDRIRKFLGAAS